MAQSLTANRAAELKEAFSIFDGDGDGEITPADIRKVMRSLGQEPSEAELRNMLKEIDVDRSGSISFDEFLTIMTQKPKYSDIQEEFQYAFKVFDHDNSGTISKDELRRVMVSLGENLTDDEINDMLKEADKDGDGTIDFNEFVNIVLEGPK